MNQERDNGMADLLAAGEACRLYCDILLALKTTALIFVGFSMEGTPILASAVLYLPPPPHETGVT